LEKREGDKKSLIIQKRKRNKHIYLEIKRDTKKKVQKLTKKERSIKHKKNTYELKGKLNQNSGGQAN